MKIVARVHAFPPEHNAGAEHMLVSMLRPLVERGHDVSVWLSRYGQAHKEYEYRGIKVIPLESRLDFSSAVRRADVLLAHLETVPSTASLARGYGKPLVVVCHNTHRPTFRDMAAGGTALAVYNSRWMEAEAEVFFAEYPKSIRPASSLIVRPPVFAGEYATKPGKAVTLVNCNPEKGGKVLRALAERMPEQEFLAVRGAYGEQILPDLPNVEIVEHVDGQDMREKVYARTRVLLMPSSYESWGRAGVEALASGIPVLAHPTPGLCESLGEAGIFVDRQDINGYEAVLRKLATAAEYRLASKRAKARSAELDPAEDLAAWCSAVESLAR
ncbi:glycosyltransferase [Streptomyces sp. SID335]|uniref:Glycosyl transferase n=1 Tax=Streptomyces venezuelae TaxID=54571 RepID=A0A5P2BLF7_STRVZ|nr:MULTISPECIES: glycosyltransferase family 4 protein [unclassified Streptomyces]NDZ98487.1 glycosyltransferase family 4 protein [Streptomyces sp. SID10116]QES31272.1 glycosyl transferase [Streptomyces venezuelae]MYY79786.1 glycosyltransferase [Streptomyces sp. SID335]MYZ16510.1 glycosyltransferase [Streptomyces sp. SID337]NDZ84477.1 glycosyltransferase family 4 protein [Streptomyces sp. SID10115]